MAEKIYKINEAIDIGYQAPNKESGLTVIAEIYLPNKEKDSNYPDVILDEVGNSGTYRGIFIPDQQGTWQLIIHKSDGDGQVANAYSVGGYNVHSVGEAITSLQSAITALGDVTTQADLDAAQTAITNAIAGLNDLDSTEVQAAAAAAITAAGLATATNVSDVQDALTTLINNLNDLDSAAIQSAAAAAITVADLATSTEVGNVQTVVDQINTKVSALDTPPMAF